MAVACSWLWDVQYARCEYLFLARSAKLPEGLYIYELCNANITEQVFFYDFLSGGVLHGSLLHSVLERGYFSNTEISQGSVVTLLRCGRMFNNHFIANLPVSLPAK